MRYFLSPDCSLKLLETPSVYNVKKDELYELDQEGFDFLGECALPDGCVSGRSEFIGYCLKEGILTKNAAKAKRPAVSPSPVPSLRYLELQITDKCNLKCGHCYIGEPRNLELSPADVKKILDEFEAMQGLRVLITGGEPLLHSGFREINSMLPDFALRKALFTNGALLTKAVLEGLNVDEIQVSIDGIGASHDMLRGKGNYKKALAALKGALGCGFDVSVSTMVHAGNIREFDEMESFFKGLGIKDWTVDVPCVTGRLAGNPGIQLPPETSGKYLRYGFGGGLHQETGQGSGGYACGLHLMSVSASGMCARCTFYSDSPAGHYKEGLASCWSKIRPVRLDELECARAGCDAIEICRGGCRHRASLLAGAPCGDALRRDIYKCVSFGKM